MKKGYFTDKNKCLIKILLGNNYVPMEYIVLNPEIETNCTIYLPQNIIEEIEATGFFFNETTD